MYLIFSLLFFHVNLYFSSWIIEFTLQARIYRFKEPVFKAFGIEERNTCTYEHNAILLRHRPVPIDFVILA